MAPPNSISQDNLSTPWIRPFDFIIHFSMSTQLQTFPLQVGSSFASTRSNPPHPLQTTTHSKLAVGKSSIFRLSLLVWPTI
ncbi:uncharacterized protein L203_105741 [Cryptococcus depauperatus CBS 7841]|uniref:Uncharacterized protein n=1 Tax=Cryptococcus depauperatus CBS 7841 TaxID=1295531 RepID=A0AAJ8M2V1_9TREE